MTWFVIIPAFIVVFLLIGQYGLRLFYGYRLTANSVEIIMFHFLPIMKIPYEVILNIRRCTLRELGPAKSGLIRFGNRLLGSYVLIERNRGLFRNVVITPDNADAFIQKVLERIRPRK